MDFWIERYIENQNWIRLLFIVYILIVLCLKLIDPVQFKFFIKIINYNQYLRRYVIDRKLNFINIFYLLILILIVISFSFFIILYNNTFFYKEIALYRYFKIFLVLIFFIITRFFILKTLNDYLNLFKDYKLYMFKILIFYSYLSIIFMASLSFIYITENISLNVLRFLIFFSLACILSFNVILLKNQIKYFPKNSLYLFYYLCAFKIAPWFWLSKLI